MSWDALVQILRDETEAEVCARIEARVRQELAQLTIYVPSRRRVSREQAQAAVRKHRGNVIRASMELGVDRATIYRKIQPQQRIVR
jgi:transcriptional regulator of acetoin/glycerol metabolism